MSRQRLPHCSLRESTTAGRFGHPGLSSVVCLGPQSRICTGISNKGGSVFWGQVTRRSREGCVPSIEHHASVNPVLSRLHKMEGFRFATPHLSTLPSNCHPDRGRTLPLDNQDQEARPLHSNRTMRPTTLHNRYHHPALDRVRQIEMKLASCSLYTSVQSEGTHQICSLDPLANLWRQGCQMRDT